MQIDNRRQPVALAKLVGADHGQTWHAAFRRQNMEDTFHRLHLIQELPAAEIVTMAHRPDIRIGRRQGIAQNFNHPLGSGMGRRRLAMNQAQGMRMQAHSVSFGRGGGRAPCPAVFHFSGQFCGT